MKKVFATLLGMLATVGAGAGTIDCAVASDGLKNYYATLTWTYAGEGPVTVQRRLGETGAWKDLAVVEGESSFVDATALYGRVYQYRVIAGEAGADASEPQSFLRVHKLSTAGASFFTNGELYKGRAPDRAFDGKVGSNASGVPAEQMGNNNDNIVEIALGETREIKIGVDFGNADNYVSFVRAFPRADNNFYTRMSGFCLYGSADDAATAQACDASGDDKLTDELPTPKSATWFTLPVTHEPIAAYRTYYAYNIANNGNVAEIELYGWTAADLAEVDPEISDTADVSDAGLTVARVAVDDIRPRLGWTAVTAPVTVERALEPEGPYTVLGTAPALAVTFADLDAPVGRVCYYRLTSGDTASNIVSFRSLRRFTYANCTFGAQGVAAWDENCTADKAFDGNVLTYPDLEYATTFPKVAVDFGADGATNHVAVVRLLPRIGWAYRLAGTTLHGSMRSAQEELATDDWSVKLTPEAPEGVDNRWEELEADPTFAYRTYYVRTSYGNVNEILLFGWTDADLADQPVPPAELTGVQVTYNALPEFKPLVLWRPLDAPVVVERAPEPAGPWSAVGTADGRNGTFCVPDAKVGILWYYRVRSGAQTSEPVPFRRMRKFDLSAFTTFGNGNPYKETATYAASFDGTLESCCDLWATVAEDNHKIKLGVDFGVTEHFVGLVHVYPRRDQYRTRLVGMTLFGSDLSAEAEGRTLELLEGTRALTPADAVSSVDVARWIDVYTDLVRPDRHVPYRTYFVTNMKEGGGNIGELEFYGWSKNDLPHGTAVLLR